MKCNNEWKISNNILLISRNDALIYKDFDISDASKETQKESNHIKNMYNNITIIENLDDAYIITTQTDNTYINNLYYDYENSQFYQNDKRLTFQIYIKNCIESIIRHIDSNTSIQLKYAMILITYI